MRGHTKNVALLGLLVVGLGGCEPGPYTQSHHRAGFSQAEIERDYLECEYKARMANQDSFYNPRSPYPFGPGPQNPTDHARVLHGLSTINAMRDTCLAAKGYRVE